MNNKKGFTLVEAAVAIGVVAVLAGIIIPLVLKNLNDARRARARNDINVIVAALASEMRDTGSRPTGAAGAGPGGCQGAGDVVWQSSGHLPNAVGGAALLAGVPAGQTFGNLLAAPPGAAANALFGLAPVGREFAYRGPYLGMDMARKADPWGNAYLILGYNANGQAQRSPIWVVSAGEAGTLAAANLAAPGGLDDWDTALAGSETNIAVRVN